MHEDQAVINFVSRCLSITMVEVAGVEPVKMVHLFLFICIHLHLPLFISML